MLPASTTFAVVSTGVTAVITLAFVKYKFEPSAISEVV